MKKKKRGVRFAGEEEEEVGGGGGKRQHVEASRKRMLHSEDDEEEEEKEAQVSASKRHENLDDLPQHAYRRWDEEDDGEQYSHEAIERLEEERMEQFNMDEERQLGTFDESGTFNWRRKDLAGEDEGGEDEAWLAQVGDQIAKQPKSLLQRGNNETAAAVARPPQQHEVMQSMWQVVRLLKDDGENAFAALKRLGRGADFDRLTDACDHVLNCGLGEVYSLSRADLIKKMDPILWEYRTLRADGGERGEVFGPFTGADMQTWRQEQGVFQSDSPDICEVRSTHAKNGVFTGPWRLAHEVETFLLL